MPFDSACQPLQHRAKSRLMDGRAVPISSDDAYENRVPLHRGSAAFPGLLPNSTFANG